MKDMKPVEVLNDNIEDLTDHLKRELRCLGKLNGLSDSQISEMERDFIARLAFAAIIRDDEKEPEKKPENKSEDLPDYVIRSLSYVNDYCNKRDCNDCIFCDQEGCCRLKYTPNEWRV